MSNTTSLLPMEELNELEHEDRILTNLGVVPEDLGRLVTEYIKDFDYFKAAKRARMPYNVVWQVSRLSVFELMLSTLVDGTEDLTKLITRNRVAVGLWREACNELDGTPNSRISALARLSALLGYDAAQQIDLKVDLAPKLEIRLARGAHDKFLNLSNVIDLDSETETETDPDSELL